MEQNRNLYVGFDLGNENSQISCYRSDAKEIETIGGKKGDHYFFIPTSLFVTADKKEWFFGEYANMLAEYEKGIQIQDIVKKAAAGESFTLFGVEFTSAQILEKFFKKTLVLLRSYYPNDKIKKITVTMQEKNGTLEQAVYEALSRMGIEKDRANVEDYGQSFLYYVLNQKPEIWEKDAALFHYGREGLIVSLLKVNRGSKPMAAAITTKDYRNAAPYSLLEEQKESVRGVFSEIVDEVLRDKKIETLYFVGEGFLSDWADKLLLKICVGKKGFRGPNIYTRGACYSARFFQTPEFSERFFLLQEGTLDSSISIRVYKDGVIDDLVLIPAGLSWSEAKAEITVIFDKEEEIRFLIKKVMEKEGRVCIISPEGLPERPDRMGRFEISLYFHSERDCHILIKDKGFGVFAPSTNRIWEKRIEI